MSKVNIPNNGANRHHCCWAWYTEKSVASLGTHSCEDASPAFNHENDTDKPKQRQTEITGLYASKNTKVMKKHRKIKE